MSRTKAKQSFTVSEFKKQMKDVYTTSVNKETLDESPMAYKNMDNIVTNTGRQQILLKLLNPYITLRLGKRTKSELEVASYWYL